MAAEQLPAENVHSRTVALIRPSWIGCKPRWGRVEVGPSIVLNPLPKGIAARHGPTPRPQNIMPPKERPERRAEKQAIQF